MKIRKIEYNEINDWASLRNKLWPEDNLALHFKEAEQMLSLPEKYCVFGCFNTEDEIIGFVEVSIRESMDRIIPERVGYIEGWYVKKQYRRKGFGKALFLVAEKWVQQKGCKEILSDTNLENQFSQKAHQALGYKEIDRLILYRKILQKN
jgi:aminoglycoside 6'-N-acetyltransferase I